MQILEKRTADNRLYDVDCSLLLDPTETITSITSVAADQGDLVFGQRTINSAIITYPSGRKAQIGKVAQVFISGGVIPPGQLTILCLVRVLMITSANPALEATVVLKLTDTPGM